jgi:Na+:H+ antiporter, NhaA family
VRSLPRRASRELLLLFAVALSLVAANSPLSPAFAPLWTGPFHYVINHALMALFFLLVGLELKRELVSGDLRSPRRAALPAAAAVGGLVVPGLVYLAIARDHPRGWGIPCSTDTAFALAVLSLLGHRAPARLRPFLAAFAITDDVGAVLIIALFYSTVRSPAALLIAAGALAALLLLRRLGARHIALYLLAGVPLWIALDRAGVHASVAGIPVAAALPAHGTPSPLRRLERALDPWVAWGVLPLFALANAGVVLPDDPLAPLRHPVPIAIALGLLVGKPVGVLLACFAALALRLAHLPHELRFRHLLGAAALSGIGFTMALFIATIAFGDEPAVSLDDARLAILVASLLSGLLGALILARRR